MDQLFNVKRWVWVVRWHWAENRKRYLLSGIAIPGMLLICFGYRLLIGGIHPLRPDLQYLIYLAGLYITGCFYASALFSELGSRPKGIHFLALPASPLEKLVCLLLFGVVLLFVYYTLSFYLLDYPMVKLGNQLAYERFQDHHLPNARFLGDKVLHLLQDQGEFHEDFINFFIAYFPVQSAFILGSVYFPNYSFLKTTVALLVFWVVLVLVFVNGFNAIRPEAWQDSGFAGWWQLDDLGQFNRIRLSSWVESAVGIGLKFSIPFILWVITYFRLREKEI
jgi:hypothetical protein